MIENSKITATVFLAALTPKNGRLAITGQDELLGKWKDPQGTFERLIEIEPGVHIFKGTVPVPSRRSDFKFVEIVNSTKKIEYEGDGKYDNRRDELLPDSWNFFIYKHRSENLAQRAKNFVTQWFGSSKTEVARKITTEFLSIIYNRAIEEVSKDWNSGVLALLGHLEKIRKAKDGDISEEFRHFINQQLNLPEVGVNFDHLFLLVIGACKLDIYSKSLQEFIAPKYVEFSRYLSQFKYPAATNDHFLNFLEKIAINGGRKFWWILFRFNRVFSERWRKIPPKDLSLALMETLSEIPEVLLNNNNCVSRVLDFLLQHIDIDLIVANVFPAIDNNAQLKKVVEDMLMTQVFAYKSSVSELEKILNSGFVHTIFDRKLQTDSNEALKLQQKEKFDRFLAQIYGRSSLFETMLLACSTPTYLLPTAISIVEPLVIQKLILTPTLSARDYKGLAEISEEKMKNFPSMNQKIGTTLLRMTMEHLKSGSFKEVASLKLALLGLSKKEELSFLNRCSCIDLQKAISKVPKKFFHNLHSAFDSKSSQILSPFRKGETRIIVERLEVCQIHSLFYLTFVLIMIF